ncbi:DUF3108 domain-containing protein [Aliiglaciecola sp. 3_MG-2023]|uniref:DUF3108 domain-containing protein n=1 Tax=Aliiglaciecola sp. 3_MG-2023 TaxID=3062644 RepID=UPI0026E2B3A5|nr:DUF3108 domain-containing protein [Aliiglaciecola sp. 3_MG-2023]MDO6693706.1 DUF3108 domain-containing protein [Aliiglaciecola sp. 3_MG-2023]
MDRNFLKTDMRLIKCLFSGIVLFCLTLGASAHAAELIEFDAQYKAFRYGKELGTAELKLESLGRERFRLSYQSKVSMFFLSDKRSEVSLFSFTDDKIVPFKYNYERTGFGSDKSLVAQFDRQKNSIKINNDSSLHWHNEFDNQLYRLDIQLQLAEGKKDLQYNLLNYRGELRQYNLVVMSTEQLSLPYGLLEGVKVKIVRPNSSRETYAWFAPSLNYQLVRLKQLKDGEEQGDIQLSAFSSGPEAN